MKKILITTVQFLVGGLFIFSGLVKMNDPVGFSFKLEEYFSEEVLNLPFLEPLALALAIALVVAEVLLGVALILGVWRKATLTLLTAMIVFFTFLTFWSAYFNQVTDCGCFGDAIPLTPWESFYKDVILSVLIAVLWWGQRQLFSAWPKALIRAVWAVVLVFSAGFTTYVMRHLPYVDFRPYAEGLSIIEGMKSAEELGLQGPQYEVYYTLENENTGERVELASAIYLSEKWWEKKEWKFIEELSRTEKVKDGYEPPVHDFAIVTDYGDLTDSILAMPEVWLLVAYNERKTSAQGWEHVLPQVEKLEAEGTPYFLLSASTPADFAPYGVEETIPFGFTDETTLKTMVRSNPGWVVLRNGTVEKKYHHNDSPR